MHPGGTSGDPGADAGRAASGDVVASQARTELDRIRRRWAELPIARAEQRVPVLRHLLADLAPRTFPRLLALQPPERPQAEVAGAQEVAEVPDLGPAVVVDQLSVLVWDAYAQGNGDGIPDLLTAARRALA